MRGNAIILNTIANTLNAGGSAIVTVFDAGTTAFNTTMSALSRGEKSQMRRNIHAAQNRIQALHLEIAKEASKCADPSEALESESIKKLLADIKALNADIETMKQRIEELATCKPEKKKPAPVEKKAAPAEKKTVQATVGVADFFIKSISQSISDMLSGKKSGFEKKIADHEKMIQALHLEIAKETAKYEDPTAAIGTEAVIAIVAKINEHKAEIAMLKQNIAEKAEAKKAKITPVTTEAPVSAAEVTESAAVDVVPVAVAAIEEHKAVTASPADPISSNRVAAFTAEPPETEDAGVDYSRSKPCLTPTPTLVPPTREDVQSETRVETREERIRKILEAHDTAATESIAPKQTTPEEVPVDDEATVEMDPVELETEAIEDLAAIEVEAAVHEEETVVEPEPVESAVAESVEETEVREIAAIESAEEPELPPVQEDPVSESLTVLEERVDEILTTAGVVQTETEPTYDEESVPVESGAGEESADHIDASMSDELPTAEDEKKKSALIPKPEGEKLNWSNVLTAPDDATRVRTKVLATSFSPGTESFPDLKQQAKPYTVSIDDSGPVFSTRMHHNPVSKTAAEAASVAPGAAFAPFRSAVSSIDKIKAAKGLDEPVTSGATGAPPTEAARPGKSVIPNRKTGPTPGKNVSLPAKKAAAPAKGMSGSAKNAPSPAKSVAAASKSAGNKQAPTRSEPVAGGKKGNGPVKKRK